MMMMMLISMMDGAMCVNLINDQIGDVDRSRGGQ